MNHSIKYIILLLVSFVACKQQNPQSEMLRLPNGYDYKFHTQNEGLKPRSGQVVSIDFDIIDDFGNVLSDSRKANIRPTIQIPDISSRDLQTSRNPLLALVEQMTSGDSASVLVPVDSLSTPPTEFLQSKRVEYRVKLYSIETQKEYMNRIGSEQQRSMDESLSEASEALEMYQSGKLDDVTVEKNGEVKLAIVKNTNGVKADYDELAFVHYYGFFKDGSSFDNSYKLGKPYAMRVGLGRVIQGWDVAIPDIPEGATAIIDIPYQMAYGNGGKQGSIPPKSDLIFWVKIEKVEKSKEADN